MSKIQATLQQILTCFESGKIPEAIAYSTFPIPDVPSSQWSFLNRTLMFLSSTADARGFNQWMSVKRYVKKGSKAFYILIPRFTRSPEKDDKGGKDDKDRHRLIGFMGRPVFRMEDTQGESLSYQEIKTPALPLIEKAQQWGISVKTIPGNYKYYGYFSSQKQEIAIASKEETIFFHELAHAAHYRIHGKLDHIQTWQKEVVAELSAAALCRVVGKTSKYTGNQYQYIAHYAEKAKLTPINACMKVLADVEKVLAIILDNKTCPLIET